MTPAKKVQELISAPAMTEQERKNYAAQVGAVRKMLGYTQADLAEMAGVSRGTVVNIESGKIVPQADNLWRVMLALDMTVNVDAAAPEWISEYMQILVPLMRHVPESERSDVMGEVIMLLAQRAKK